jgi:hypothetical protein
MVSILRFKKKTHTDRWTVLKNKSWSFIAYKKCTSLAKDKHRNEKIEKDFSSKLSPQSKQE